MKFFSVVKTAADSIRAAFFSIGRWFKKHRRPVGIIAAIVAVLGIGAYALLPVPHAQGGLKGRRVEIYRNAEMRVIFDQKMDTGSVERAWKLTPAVRGAFRWEDNAIVFKPAEPLEKGQSYELEVSDAARNLFGKKLNEPFRQTFAVLDYPEVATVIPSSETVVRSDQTLTVLFDHPVRTLSIKTVPPELLRITPAVSGALHWLGTSGFEFVPATGWPMATTFTATVPKGTKMADGSVTIEDKAWSFSTAPVQAFGGSDVYHPQYGPDDAFIVFFNYPVSAEAVRGALTVKEGEKTLGKDAIQINVDPKDSTRFLVKKNGGWSLGQTYILSIPKGFTAGIGPNGLPTDWSAQFTTYEKTLKITTSMQDRMSVSSVATSYIVRFNNPLPKKIPAGWITVSPSVENLELNPQDDYWYGDTVDTRGNTWISISGKWKPSTTYTITLNASVADVFGQKLGEAKKITLDTNPYRTSVSLSTYARNGVMASHVPRLYQMRGMNASAEWRATICSGSVQDYLREQGMFSCDKKSETTFRTDGELNKYKIVDLDLDVISGSTVPNGFYQLEVNPLTSSTVKDEWGNWSSPFSAQARNVAVIDTAITMKQDNANHVLVWATDLKTGEPVANLPVELYRLGSYGSQEDASLQVRGTTDAQGLVTLIIKDSGTDRPRLAVVAKDKTRLGIATTDWNDGIAPWSYGLEEQWQRDPSALVGYIYTDRRIYRSDHLVQFKGILREDQDAALRLPSASHIQVSITDGDGNEVATPTFGISPFGTFWGSFQLDPSMPLGQYRICTKEAPNRSPVCGSFDVREYRRPDFKVSVDVPTGIVIAGAEAQVRIHGEYYHGASLAGAKARYTITRTASYFSPSSLWREWYNYSLDDGRSYCYWYCRNTGNAETVATGDVVLDAQGNAIVRIPTALADAKTGMDYSVDVTVEDLNARTVSANASFTAHPAELYAGIRANYEKGWSAPEVEFDLITVGADGVIRPNTSVTVSLAKRVWKNIQKEGADGEMRWESTAQDTPVASKSLSTGADGKALVSFGSQADGLYVAVVEAKDAAGRSAKASSERYVYRSSFGDEYGYRISDDRQMRILQSKASYDPGETASLAVQSPYASVKALVTVERDSLMSSRVVTLDAQHRTIDIPLTDTSVPNVYVSVLAIKGGGEKDIPDFKLGYAQLQVGTAKKVLDLSVTADKTEYRPGETATLTVRAKTLDGRPAKAEVSLAVVDERVVSLLGSVDKDVLGKFWFPRRLGVFTAQSLTVLVKKVFFDTPEGGDGKGGASVPSVRGNFLDTALWKADVITGDDGTATVHVALPDNLTSWQALAIGTTKETVVGSAETKFKTRKTLMAEPLLPRIMREGDVLSVGTTIFNGTPASLEVRVNVEATGARIKSEERIVTVPANGRVPVRWEAVVPEGVSATSASMTIRAAAPGLDDGFRIELPILPSTVPEILGTSGILDGTVTEAIEIPEDASMDRGGLVATVTPSLSEGLNSGIDYLLDYTYGCAEQTTSAMLASVVYTELVNKKLVTVTPENAARATAKVKTGIAKLRAMQAENGGFGYWSANDTVYPHLTAYTFWGLTRAKKAGFEVDENMLSRADSYLRNYLANNTTGNENWRYGDLSDDERTQTVFALSERDPNGLDGYVQTLFERRANLSTFAKAFLAMAAQNVQGLVSSSRASTLMDEVKNRITVLERFGAYVDDGNGYDYFMSSPVRSTAIVLMAYQRLAPSDQMNERLLRYLLHEKRDGYWNSTQSTAFSLLALTEYVTAHPVDTATRAVDLFLDGKRATTLAFEQGDKSPAQSHAFDFVAAAHAGRTHEIGLEKSGGNRAFYDVTMKVYRPFGASDPVENGFTVLSDIYALDDVKNTSPLSEVTVGQNVRVHLKILVPKEHQYVATEYHLPAGLEAVDFSLNTSPKEIAGQQKQCSPGWDGKPYCYEDWEMSYWWGNAWKHVENRDDRVFLFADSLQPGVYEYDAVAQATTPGRFRIPPTQVFEFYHPEVRGATEGRYFTVKGR